MSDLNLALVGNCSFGALVDSGGRIIWCSLSKFDGDPVFNSLLNRDSEYAGFSDVMIEDFKQSRQEYMTPHSVILKTVLESNSGSSLEIIDIAPRFKIYGRTLRNNMFVRRIRPLQGDPYICIRCRPTFDYNTLSPDYFSGSNHIRFIGCSQTLRVTTDVPISYILKETTFILDQPKHLIMGSDESLARPIVDVFNEFLHNTQVWWTDWARGLTLPFEYQPEITRAAVTLQNCFYEETGAIIQSHTTSIPDINATSRGDVRLVFLKDAGLLMRAMSRLGMISTLDGYLSFLKNVLQIYLREKINLLPCIQIQLDKNKPEEEAKYLAGYKGLGVVRVGISPFLRSGHFEIYGNLVYALSIVFHDSRLNLHSRSNIQFLESLEKLGIMAYNSYNRPGNSYYLPNENGQVHTISALWSWVACDRLSKIARKLSLTDRARDWEERASVIEDFINTQAWNGTSYTAVVNGSSPHPCLLIMCQIGFAGRNREKFESTVRVLEETSELKLQFTYLFWFIEALYFLGRESDGRALYDSLLKLRNPVGIVSSSVNLENGDLWGNIPDCLATASLISAGFRVSRSWSDVI